MKCTDTEVANRNPRPREGISEENRKDSDHLLKLLFLIKENTGVCNIFVFSLRKNLFWKWKIEWNIRKIRDICRREVVDISKTNQYTCPFELTHLSMPNISPNETRVKKEYMFIRVDFFQETGIIPTVWLPIVSERLEKPEKKASHTVRSSHPKTSQSKKFWATQGGLASGAQQIECEEYLVYDANIQKTSPWGKTDTKQK
jgi:hypothetical protein